MGRRHLRRAAAAATLLGLYLCATASRADDALTPCGPLRPEGQYGPWDYRKDFDKLPIVLGAHFTTEVEMLIRGRTSGTPGGDIDYTLRAIPNNPRALIAMMNLGAKEKRTQPIGAHYSVECYFERAIRFQPEDQMVRMIYATYLMQQNRADEARTQLGVVESLLKDDPFTHYNLGLLYFDLKDYDKALAHANTAYAAGMAKTTLKDKLASVGRQVEGGAEAPQAAP